MKTKMSKCMLSMACLSLLASLAGCGGATADTITACLASEPASIDPALNSSVDGASYIVHAFSGLYSYVEEGGQAVLKPACAKEAPKKTANADGTITYDFTLRDDLKWSDGSKLDAKDFVFGWNRAASGKLGADYAYMFEVVKGGVEAESDATGAAKLDISASDDGTHFFCTLVSDVPYFYELCAFPTFMPVKEGVVDDDGTWATSPSTYITNGAYYLDSWDHDSQLVFKKNPNFYDAASIKTEKLVFALSDDAANMYANFENGTYDLIDDIPLESLDAIKAKYPDEYKLTGQLGTYYICFNVDSETFSAKADTEEKRTKVRQALSLMLDRNYVVNSVAKGGQTPANAFVATGLTDPKGGEFVDHNGEAEDGSGYFSVKSEDFASNCDKAVAMLKEVGYNFDETSKKFTDVPTVTYLYNTSSGHKAIAEYVQSAWAAYGISSTLENQEWATFLDTRKAGNYDVARNGWLADYNDPISFLDMWVTASGNNDVQLGKGANASYAGYSIDLNIDGTISDSEKNLTWAQSYDVIIDKIKKESDTAKRYEMMHKAETLLMSTGTICPIYNYTDMYMISTKIKGFFSSPLGYKFFLYSTKEA